MNRDAIANATGEEWEYVSYGPDHTKIRAVYEQDPNKWELWGWWLDEGDSGAVKKGTPAGSLGWFSGQTYRMKRRQPAEWPKWDRVDTVNRPSPSAPLQRGGDAVNAVDQVRGALSPADFRGWCRGNAMIHMLNLDAEGKQAEWALWWMRMSVGDDPRE